MPTPTDPFELPESRPAPPYPLPPPSGVSATSVLDDAPFPPELTTGEKIAASRRRRQRRVPFVVRLWGAIRRGWASLLAAFASATASGHAHQPKSLMQRIVAGTPAWFVSLLVHASLMLMLGWIAIEAHEEITEEMAVEMAPVESFEDEIFAETIGDQLEVPTTGMTPDDLSKELSTTYSISDGPEVDDPLSAPPDSLDMSGDGSSFFSEIETPSIGNALEGRQEGRKEALIGAYGGTMTTQDSVKLALAWIARQQGKDGSWALDGPYSEGSNAKNRLSATAMAMLAFLGDGHTHLQDGPYRRQVLRGYRAMAKLQGKEGEFIPDDAQNSHHLYTHAQCTIVMCELYGLTQDSEVREVAMKAVEYCVKIQSAEGGWRYFPGQQSDTSVTGWFVMALQSARMAKLDVPQETLDRVKAYLDTVSSHEGSRYAYLPDRVETPPMTAEALLCRQYLGWKRDDSRLLEGVAYVGQHPVDWKSRNVYYWYYATQVMHHMGGKPWVEWNKVMRQVVPENQIPNGKERGSWDPTDDQWGGAGGRLFVTCLSTYMLEVYYRHMPLYSVNPTAQASAGSTESR